MSWARSSTLDGAARSRAGQWSPPGGRGVFMRWMLIGLVLVVAFWLTVPQATRSGVVLQWSLAAVAVVAMVGAPRAPGVSTCVAGGATAVAWLLGLTADPFTLVAAGLYVYARRHGRTSLARSLCVVVAFVFVTLLAVSVGGVESYVRSAMLSFGVLASAWVLGVRTRHEHAAVAARAVAEERVRASREVHDVLSHTLGFIGMRAGMTVHGAGSDVAPRDEALRDIERSAREGVEQLRAVLDRERSLGGPAQDGPEVLPGRVLARELDDLAADCRRAGLAAEVEVVGDVDGLSAPVATTIGRVAREAATNVMRHAQASRLSTSVRVAGAQVEVCVADDGRGDVTTLRPGHGLTGLRERVELAGGATEFASRPGGGLVLRVTLPLHSAGVRGSSW